MRTPAKVCRMTGDGDDLVSLSNLLVEDHVFRALDPRLRSFIGVHRLFCGIASGAIKAYAALGDKGEFLGCFFGALNSDAEFEGHALFHRGVDVAAVEKMTEAEMRRDYRENFQIEVTTLAGCIPVENRAANRMARRAGFKLDHISSDEKYKIWKKVL